MGTTETNEDAGEGGKKKKTSRARNQIGVIFFVLFFSLDGARQATKATGPAGGIVCSPN